MYKFIDWIEKHKVLTLVLVMLLFVFPLFIVQCLFKWKSGITWMEAEWAAGEVLGYIAGFETLLATSVLSYVALSQTRQFKKSEEFSAVADTKRPFFSIEKVTVKKNKQETKVDFITNRYEYISSEPTTLYVYLKNIGDGIANECSYAPYGFGEVPINDKPIECILVNEKYCIPCRLVSKDDKITTKTITIYYQNILGFRYKQILIINAKSVPILCGEDDICTGYSTYVNMITPQVVLGFANTIKPKY